MKKKSWIAILIPLFFVGISSAQDLPQVEITREESVISQTTTYPNESEISSQVRDLYPEKRTDINESDTEILIRTNVQGASVYLNGVYQGRTPLTVRNLTPGIYELSIEKEGFSRQYFFMTTTRGQQHSYYIQLEKSTGWISVNGVPFESDIYIDDEMQYSMPIEVAAGTHTLTIKKFGYNDIQTNFQVEPRSHTSFSVSMTKAQFEISDIKASRARFNPSYENTFGRTEFYFTVTAPETGIFTVQDAYGDTVYSQNLSTFKTWSQYVTWAGHDSYGNILPEGQYTASVTVGGITKYAQVTLDKSVAFVPCNFTPGGTGIGVIASAFMLPEKTFFLSANIAPTFSTKENPFTALPIAISFGYTPISWLEVSAHANIYAAMKGIPTSITIAAKAAKTFPLNDSMNIAAGAFLRWGAFIKFEPAPLPSGIDVGTGLSGGAAAAFSTKLFYAGISSEYTFGAATGNLAIKDSVWRNAVTFQLRPTQKLAVQTWMALNSAFNIYDIDTGTSTNRTNWANALETGISASTLVGNTALMLNAGIHAVIFFDNVSLFSIKVGAAWLF